jgi:hypothetical protein
MKLHEIKEIETMVEELEYMLKNFDLCKLNSIEIHELYIGLSRAWLILSKTNDL